MTQDDVVAAIRHFKSLPMPPGVFPRFRKVRLGGLLAVQVDLFCGGRVAEPIKLTHPYDESVGRYVVAESRKLADAACGGSGVRKPPEAPPGAGDGPEPSPRWMRATLARTLMACGGDQFREARILAHSEVECKPDGRTYRVSPKGFADHPLPFDVAVVQGRSKINGKPRVGTKPELLRTWVWELYCDADEYDFGWDADDFLAEACGWSDAEIGDADGRIDAAVIARREAKGKAA